MPPTPRPKPDGLETLNELTFRQMLRKALDDGETTRALELIPHVYAQPDPSTLSKLPKPTKSDNAKGECNVCGGWHGLPAVHIDYQGHADVTLAFLEVDPEWNWEPMALTDDGTPLIHKNGNRLTMWGTLTILGVTRKCVGTCEAAKGDPEKELIGDLLRNGAMRFGFATKLWSKADRADPAGTDVGGYSTRRERDEIVDAGDLTLEQQAAKAFSELPADKKRSVTKAALEAGIPNVMRPGLHAQTLLDIIATALGGPPSEEPA